MKKLVDPRELGAKCSKCPFARGGRPFQPVMGEGPKNALGIIVGESPGREEAEKGRPFVGSTGQELDEALKTVGLPRTKLFIVNAMACRPPKSKTEGMMRKAMKCCRPAVKAQIRGIRAKSVFAAGKWAIESATKSSKGMKTRRGFIEEVVFGGRKRRVIPSFHPTFAFFYSPFELGAFMADLDRFARMIHGKLEKPPHSIIIQPTVADVKRMFREPVVAVDIETAPMRKGKKWQFTGKDPTRARLKTIGLGCKTWGLSYWWKGDGNAVERAIKAGLADPRIKKIGHNYTWFDDRVLRRYGITTRNLEDTRDLRRALSATSRLSLAYLGSIYCDLHAWKTPEDDK